MINRDDLGMTKASKLKTDYFLPDQKKRRARHERNNQQHIKAFYTIDQYCK